MSSKMKAKAVIIVICNTGIHHRPNLFVEPASCANLGTEITCKMLTKHNHFLFPLQMLRSCYFHPPCHHQEVHWWEDNTSSTIHSSTRSLRRKRWWIYLCACMLGKWLFFHIRQQWIDMVLKLNITIPFFQQILQSPEVMEFLRKQLAKKWSQLWV